ncbi:MAG: DNA polymerase III subunit delta [Oscillospiraceae bacterium]
MKNIIKDLKLNNFKRLYYLYGKDLVSIERLLDTAIKCIVPNGDDFNLYKFDGKNLNLDEFLDVAEACPMFADYKCILVKDLNCEDFSTDFLKELLSILDKIPKSSIIIFYVIGFDITNGKKYPTAKNKKLIDYVSKNGQVFEAIQKTLEQTTKEIQTICQSNGSFVSHQVAQTIANKCLCNSLTVKMELSKVIAYANGKEITLSMVNDLVSNYYDVNAFAFAKAVVSMNGQLSYKLLNELYTLRTEPIAVLSAVAVSFLDLYRVKTALATGRSEYDILNDFNYKGREFIIRNYIRDTKRIKLEHIRDCLNILKKANLEMISTSIDGKILLEKAVADMINSGYKYH